MKELGTPRELIKKWKSGKIPWTEVAREYKKVLKNNETRLLDLAELSRKWDITLLCSCNDIETCHRSLLAKEISNLAKVRLKQ